MSGEAVSEAATGRTDSDVSGESGEAGVPSGIIWDSVEVDGHRVHHGVTGTGPAALFLHGWGLRPNAYRQPIEAMSAAGCRVYAPALPGFGGTRELDPELRTFAGYATWVGRFLDAVDPRELALVAGHS